MIIFQAIILSLATTGTTAEPYKNMSIGMAITLPSGASVVATSSDPPSCMIQGGIGQASWHMKFDRILETDQKTPQELTHLAYERQKSEDKTRILDDKAITIGNIKGWWLRTSLYIKEAHESTLCWLALPVHGDQAIMASILTTTEGWQRSGPSILASLQSILTLDPATVLTQRISGLDSASTLLSDLSSESLSPCIGLSYWRQIQQFQDGQIRPIDIGYAHITSRIGTISEIGTSIAIQGEKGLLVEVRSRIIPDQETKIVTDTVGYYWMSFDGKEEMWSSITSRWKGKIKTVEKETGIRNRPTLGEPNPKLLILRQDVTSNRQLSPIEAKITNPWLPKTLTWIIGPWLNKGRPSHLSWKTLNDYVDPPAETMRTDEIKSTAFGFSVTTRMGDSDALVVTQYDLDGQFLSRTLGNGAVIFGTNEKTLQAIWEPKGLW
jgi:hypothetical protein